MLSSTNIGPTEPNFTGNPKKTAEYIELIVTSKQKELSKLIWQERIKSMRGYLGIIVLIVAVLAFVLLARMPIGTPENLVVDVIAATTMQGADGNGTYLDCKLPSGEQISVFLPANSDVFTNVQATVLKTQLLFGGERYSFVKYN